MKANNRKVKVCFSWNISPPLEICFENVAFLLKFWGKAENYEEKLRSKIEKKV